MHSVIAETARITKRSAPRQRGSFIGSAAGPPACRVCRRQPRSGAGAAGAHGAHDSTRRRRATRLPAGPVLDHGTWQRRDGERSHGPDRDRHARDAIAGRNCGGGVVSLPPDTSAPTTKTTHRKPSWLVKRRASDAGSAARELRSVTMNEAQDHQRLPAGSADVRPSHLRAERSSWLAVSWRGLSLAALLFACLAALIYFVL
jgi:hypothetical protein